MATHKQLGAPIEAQIWRKIAGGLILAVLLTIFLAFWSWHSARRAEQDSYWLSHTYQVMTVIERISRHVIEAETSARSFASSGQEPLLSHYQAACESIYLDEDELRHLTADNLSQQRRLEVLAPQVRLALDFAQSIMAKRRKLPETSRELTNGPGKLCQAFGIDKRAYGLDLCKNPLFLADGPAAATQRSARIGVQYAEDWAKKPWRFFDPKSPYVSRARP